MGKTDEKVKDFEVKEMPRSPTFIPAFNTNASPSFKRQTSSNKILRADEIGTLAVPGNFPGDLYEL